MMDAYQEFIFKSRYARWMHDCERREDWHEAIDRYLDFFDERFPDVVGPVRAELFDAISNMNVMPSMRALMTAGPALERDEVASYNCSYLPIDSLRSFDEALYLLLCGCGVGFSCERQYISELPAVADDFHSSDIVITVADSKIGWCKALKETIALAFSGQVPSWDFSKVRPSGAPLKTFGGRASGPAPLEKMLKDVLSVIRGASGRRLTSIEAHDIMCHIASCVVVGGVRRAAMISLSNLSDQRMAKAKSGQWWELDGQRALSNNSVVYTDKPDVGAWMQEWQNIYESKSGERGIFNREAGKALSPERRDTSYEFGCNPCSEILLRPRGLCNLTEVVVRPDDRGPELIKKIKVAAVLGSLQATLTSFRYLSSAWKRNSEEEALLGLSLTGIYDNKWLVNLEPSQLQLLKQVAIDTNIEYAKKLGINQAAATTCVKPSGSVSQVVDSASGIHPRYGKFYWRRVRNDKKDPISDALIEAGVPHVTDPYNHEAWSFTFPKRSPKGAVVNADITALEHLETWKKFALHWCEHKPSVTVSVALHEWPEIGAWCWNNFDILSGVSFLPKEDENHTYMEAPYELCTAQDIKGYPKVSEVNWDGIAESQDKQTEFACSSGACEI
jgi:ribonucleoside-diphosphate reductase alpha chain